MGTTPLVLFGLGRMGRIHLDVMMSVKEVEVIAVVDPFAAFTSIQGVPVMSSAGGLSGEELGWVIASPTSTHLEIVASGIERGRHILCEKPLSLDVAATRRIGKRVGDLTLQVGFWRRFSAPWIAARSVIAAGGIGRPVLLRLAQWDANPPPPAFCDPSVSGGLAIDCGVHEYDLAEWLTGLQVQRARGRNLAIVDAAVAEMGDVDNLVADLILDSDVAAIVDLSRNARYGDDVRTEILGTDGALFVDTLPHGSTRLATSMGTEFVAGSSSTEPMIDGLRGQLSAFVGRIATNSGDIPGVLESARATAIGHAITASASGDGSWIDIAD